MPLRLLADTDCEELELALRTNVVGPFRLTKALLGALSASARDGRGSVVLNVSSDAGVNAYPEWGAYGASKAALHHMSRIWGEELAAEGISFLSLDPGDMDTPLHALAVPDSDRSTLKRPETAARELADAIAGLYGLRIRGREARRPLPMSGSEQEKRRPGASLSRTEQLRVSRSPGSEGFSRVTEMIAAQRPVQRPRDARLLVVDATGV